MSLMHLLSKSPTFTGARNKADDYKVVPSSLPKFAPAKRPILLAPQKPVSVKPVQPTLFEAKKPAKAPVVVVVAAPVKPVAAPVAAQAKAEPVSAAPKPKRGWKTIFKELFLGRRSRTTGQKTVQTELALDQVTVVRNDLAEADIEVVSRKPLQAKATPAAAGETQRLAKRDLAGMAWTRLTARLFNPNEFAAKSETKPSEAPEALVVAKAPEIPAESIAPK